MSVNNSDSSVKDVENAHSVRADAVDTLAYNGVKTIEASQKVYEKYSKWLLFLRFILLHMLSFFAKPYTSLGLAAYIYSLDGTTTWSYLAFAVSSFGKHSLISAIQVAQAVISV